MESISGIISSGLHTPSMDADKAEPIQNQQPGEEVQSHLVRIDRYVSSEKRDLSGRYRPVRDADGRTEIRFDDPNRVTNSLGGNEPERERAGKEAQICTADTDKVDREIEQLKQKQEDLNLQLSHETDETKIASLQKQLAQVESELRQKDNDTYRRQHTVFS